MKKGKEKKNTNKQILDIEQQGEGRKRQVRGILNVASAFSQPRFLTLNSNECYCFRVSCLIISISFTVHHR